MKKRLLLVLAWFCLVTLYACAPSGPTASIQRFADAVVKEDYAAAATYWIPSQSPGEEQIRQLLVALRADMVGRYGAIKGATVQDLNPEKKSVIIIWKLEQADFATVWAAEKPSEQGEYQVAWSPFFGGAAGRLADGTAFATFTPSPTHTPSPTRTPSPTSTPSAAELSITATVAARETAQAQKEATQTAVAWAATATEQARPPATFLTAKQAFTAGRVRELARAWSDDALLVRVTFEANDTNVTTPSQDSALDGTSRYWSYRFASPSMQKTNTFIIKDGALLKETGNDAALYKEMFAGQGQPFDLDLEHTLDSDQIATIGRENGADPDTVSFFEMALTEHVADKLLKQGPGQWRIRVMGLFGYNNMYLDSITGEILKSDFGPTGSPGSIPTPMATPSSGTIPAPETSAGIGITLRVTNDETGQIVSGITFTIVDAEGKSHTLVTGADGSGRVEGLPGRDLRIATAQNESGSFTLESNDERGGLHINYPNGVYSFDLAYVLAGRDLVRPPTPEP
ncbi:hypothetical protein F8S13_01015 [Chloroflexia bacterium SDU3-3]|nr:hypothetical protein F8S13_01015 [Chloroflexia bacterium SDU3-3]